MKNLLIIFLLYASASCAQTTIDGARIRNGSITQPKLSADALRPVSSGALSGTELTFDQPSKKYTLPVTSDIALTLAASGNVPDSRILILATGDGSHTLSFPSSWIVTGTFNPENFQHIFLYYDGTYVTAEIKQVITATIPITLTSAVVTNTPPTALNLTFSEPVTITTVGWTVTASGGAVILEDVAASGTATPVFNMNRAIGSAETVTISYDVATGQALSVSGTREISAITNQSVTPPDELPDPEVPQFDIVVGPGETYTTIQAGTNAATSGDIIGIKGGTYRETIVGKSGIHYKPFPGETVTVSGLELVGTTGWTVHSGNIYKKTITLPVQASYHNAAITSNTTLLSNQILKDGEMMITAQWPNREDMDDLFDQSKLRRYSNTSTFTATQITDAGLGAFDTGPLSNDGLTGARVYTQGWFRAFNSNITAHSGNTITMAAATSSTGISGDARFRKYYYVADALSLLDVANEWFYNPSTDDLYVWQIGGGSPTGLEYKARNYGFDLRSASNVTIEGLHFIGCEPVIGSLTSDNLVVDNIRAKYMNHGITDLQQSHPGFGIPRKVGMTMIGDNNVVKNSEFEKSSSTVIWAGENCRIENNFFKWINYEGNWGAPVNAYDKAGGIKFLWNTATIIGRGVFDYGWINWNGTSGGQHLNVEIAYNDMGNFGKTCWDLGAIYAHGSANLTGQNVHHNWIHDVAAPDGNDVGSNSAIYYDQSSGGGDVHHNVTWNISTSDTYHETENGTVPGGRRINYYNNTWGSTDVTNGANSSYRTYEVSPLDIQRNNIYWRRVVINWLSNNIGDNQSYIMKTTSPYNPAFTAQDPLFVGGDLNTDKGHYFLLQSGSPARNTGVSSFTSVQGTTINVTAFGAGVDKGAYDYDDSDPWVPGYNAVQGTADGIINDTDFTYAGTWSYAPNFKSGFQNNDATYTVTLNSTATYTFTGSQIAIKAEKCDNGAVARITIRNSSAATVETEDVSLYNDSDPANPGSDAVPCIAGVLQTVFTSAAFSGGTCTDCTVEIKLQTQDAAQAPDRNAIVFDGMVVTP